ncbi:hypothetical protein LOK49_LG01G00363 [Camellia lanceoleosa]|uniref:Uncharacterized protein n=1 Tax=Camellia lanceoleosa TaxID=1840588 RepID=A0ACC0J4H2_9ERIC|nr:hypothetical protein LOK49_LG01G00363 [Camellia lanceoleosa]
MLSLLFFNYYLFFRFRSILSIFHSDASIWRTSISKLPHFIYFSLLLLLLFGTDSKLAHLDRFVKKIMNYITTI